MVKVNELHYIEDDLADVGFGEPPAFEITVAADVVAEAELLTLHHGQFDKYLREHGEAA